MQPTVPWRKGQAKPFGSIPRINWAHPLARGLATYLYDAGGGVVIDLVSGRLATAANGQGFGSVVTSQYGSSWAFNGGGQTFYIQAPGSPTLDAVFAAAPFSTVAGYVRRGANGASNGGYGAIFSATEPSASNFAATWIASDPSNQPVVVVGTSNVITFSGITTPLNRLSTTAIVVTGSSAETVYHVDPVNGFNTQSGSVAATYSGNTGFQPTFYTEGLIGGDWNFNGSAFYGAVWGKRALSAAEVAELNANPWSLLVYPEDEIFSTLKGTAAGGSTYNDSVTETGSAADTDSATAKFGASATEAGSATDSVAGGAITSASDTEAGSASDTDSAGLLATAAATEAGSASDTESAGNVTAASDTESGSASDTDSAIGIYAASDTEAGSASDTDSATAVFAASDTEAGSATDSNTTGQSGTVSEAGGASDTESAIAVFGASVAEAGSATDTDSGAMVTAASATEAGSAGDTDTGANVTAASLSEAGSVSDTASTVAQTYNDSVTEAGSASDAPSNIATFRPSVSEAGSATDTPAGVGTYAATDTESGAAADSTAAAGSTVWNDSVIEAGNATDVVSFPGGNAVGWFDEWDDNEPRWWEQLQAEYQERWKQEDGFKEPSKAKKAVLARKETVLKVQEAGDRGLLSRVSAKPIAELVEKHLAAPKLVDAIRYAREIDELLERLWDEEDEEDILMLAMAA
jgi:hypothetical protein